MPRHKKDHKDIQELLGTIERCSESLDFMELDLLHNEPLSPTIPLDIERMIGVLDALEKDVNKIMKKCIDKPKNRSRVAPTLKKKGKGKKK